MKAKKMTFKDIIKSDTPALIEFSAEWCGPCKAMAPILREVAASVKTDARIIKIDVDKNQKVANKYQVRSVPTFVLFKKGEIVWRQSGMQSAKQLKNIIKEAQSQ